MSHRQFFSPILFCTIVLFGSMAPSLGMEELPPRGKVEATGEAPSNVNNDNNAIPKGKEEADDEVPLDVNNNNNVPLEEATEEVDVNDVENEPEVEQPAVLDGYENARDFHARLLREHPRWFGDNVQSYYKRIDPITSTPQIPGEDGWDPYSVSIDRAQVMRNAQETYIYNGISFDRNSFRNFDPNNRITIIPISDNTRPVHERLVDVQFTVHSSKKAPVLTRIEDYNGCLASARGNRFCLRRRITLRGELDGREGPDHMIEVEVESGRREAIILRGMELIFNKGARTTQILFDFADTEGQPAAVAPPKECRHSNGVVDNTLFCIRNRKVHEGISIYSFFDSPATRAIWVPDALNFYDQNNRGLVTLPSSHASVDDPEAGAADPIAWVLGEGNNSLYRRVQELEMQNDNRYICCHNRLFYALLPYTAICTDYLSPVPNNRVRFDYLVQVKKPSIRIADGGVGMGHHDRASGLYQSVQINNRTLWEPINEVENAHPIDFDDGGRTEVVFPAEPLDAQESIKWGDAAQRSFGTFYAKIRHCNQALADKFNTWGHLNHLELSRVELANDITWDRLFTAIGTMRQLTQFGFTYNHPVANIMARDNDDRVGRVNPNQYYLKLATCLRKLTNLRKLDIQGLWLKNHAQLGLGCQDENSVSIEVARLIGISYMASEGIKSLIFNICSLPQLESLSIDGICSKGSSHWARCTTGEKAIVAALFSVTIPLLSGEAKAEDEEFKRLVNRSADDLAQMPSLRTISVYSPGGNCINRFSQAFRERLAEARIAEQAARVAARAARAAEEARVAERAAARAAEQAARAARPNLHAGWGRMGNLFISAILDTADIVARPVIPAAQPDLPPLIVNAEVLQ